MEKSKNCTTCNMKSDKDNSKKDRTICKNCYNKKKRKINNIVLEKDAKDLSRSNKQIKDNKTSVSAYESHNHVIIGPSNVGKTYNMFKILEKIGNKSSNHIIIRSPNQNPTFKTEVEIKPIDS